MLLTMNQFITPQRKNTQRKYYSTDDSSINENDSPKRNVKRKLSFPEETFINPPKKSTSENTVCIISTFCI